MSQELPDGYRNQCDGCAIGAPINGWGNHKYPDGSRIACTKDRYAPTTEPSKPEQAESYESIWNALQQISTAAAMLPNFAVNHEGGIEAFTQNIVDAISTLAETPPASAAGERDVQDVLDAFEQDHDSYHLDHNHIQEWINKLRAALATKPQAEQADAPMDYRAMALGYVQDLLDAKDVMLKAGIPQADFPTMFKAFATLATLPTASTGQAEAPRSGFVTFPVVPTDEMIKAGCLSTEPDDLEVTFFMDAWSHLVALATQPLEQKPVHQWRKKGSMSYTWHDGHPDPEDGGGPYETRTLFNKAQPEQVAQKGSS